MRNVWTFFYGSFMNPEVLAKADVFPKESQRAKLVGWDLRLNPRATLVPSEGKHVYGILAQLSHSDIDKLYTKDWFGFGTYLPEAVLVSDKVGRHLPALTYIAWETEGGIPTEEYIRKMVDVAQNFDFPEEYIIHIRSFIPTT